MRIDILTLFPEMFAGPFSESMLGRAQESGLLSIQIHNIRDWADNKHSKADDYPFGGELPAMVLTDCVSRFVPGVLGKGESAEEESFSKSLLEYPQYTRPADFRGMAVPEVLLSGHAANIETWRHEQALEKTRENRPELLGTYGKYYKNKGK